MLKTNRSNNEHTQVFGGGISAVLKLLKKTPNLPVTTGT